MDLKAVNASKVATPQTPPSDIPPLAELPVQHSRITPIIFCANSPSGNKLPFLHLIFVPYFALLPSHNPQNTPDIPPFFLCRMRKSSQSSVCKSSLSGDCAKFYITQSMSRNEDCRDDASTESFFAFIKKELIRGTLHNRREHARSEIFCFIEAYYNGVRPHSSIQYCSPREFEEQWDAVALPKIVTWCGLQASRPRTNTNQYD